MSYILSQIISQKLPEWNDTIFSESEFFTVCERLKVRAVEWPIRSRGEYLIKNDIPFVVLRKGLSRNLWLWVALHELGHHLLHYPVTHRFSRSIETRMDREANFFAAIAMMPTWLCKIMTPAEIAAEYNYPTEIIEIRREITEYVQI